MLHAFGWQVENLKNFVFHCKWAKGSRKRADAASLHAILTAYLNQLTLTF
jgi:hypothetical protein